MEGPQVDLNFRRSRPRIQEQIELILGNRVARRNLNEPDTRTLFDAACRIAQLDAAQQPAAKLALRQLYDACLTTRQNFSPALVLR